MSRSGGTRTDEDVSIMYSDIIQIAVHLSTRGRADTITSSSRGCTIVIRQMTFGNGHEMVARARIALPALGVRRTIVLVALSLRTHIASGKSGVAWRRRPVVATV